MAAPIFLRKHEAKCRYSFFSENQRAYRALKRSYSKHLSEFLCFAFDCYFFEVGFLSLTTQGSNWLPYELQVNLYHAFGCYLMALMLFNIFVLRKFQ